jgi:hypothetical protein
LRNHAIGGLPNPVSGVGHAFHLFCLSLGSYSQIVSIGPARVHLVPLQADKQGSYSRHAHSELGSSQSSLLKATHLLLDLLELLGGGWLACWGVVRLGYLSWKQTAIGFAAILGGWGLICHGGWRLIYRDKSVTQKCLTQRYFCNTVSGMANILSTDKQTAIIAALAEGSSIRSIE